MLRQDNGQYACVAEDERRYNLGEAKEEMMMAMGLDTETEGSAMQFLRRGYRVSTLFLIGFLTTTCESSAPRSL